MTEHRAAALALTCVPAFMVALDNLVVTTALATIRADLDASVEQLGWTINAYVLTFGVLMLAGAMLGDRLGRRRMFALGLALFTAASAAAALAPSATWLIASRALQGCGAALVMPLSLALVCDAFPAGRRGAAIGAWGAVTGTAVAIGPLVGGAIVEGISWQWIFWVNVPIGTVAVLLAPRLLTESYGARRPIDAPGMLLASAGLFGVVWGIIRANELGWGSAQIVGALVAGAALLAAFVARQARTAVPLLPRSLFANRGFVTANAVSFLMMAALFGAAFVVPQYLQTALGYSPLEAGLRLLPWTGVTMLVTPLAGAWADRIGDRPLMVAGLALQAVGFGWFAAIATPSSGDLALAAPLLVAGVGISLVFPAVANAIMGGLSVDDLGLASATNSSFREIGGVLGVAVAAAVFAGEGGFTTPQLFTDGTVPALTVACGLSALGALVALAGRRRAPAVAPATA